VSCDRCGGNLGLYRDLFARLLIQNFTVFSGALLFMQAMLATEAGKIYLLNKK
jgi:hypothetical protein